jgi:ABC-type polysaccharide/polyol phosphate export permease
VREELAELWRFRGLLLQLVRRDLKVRYKNSRLGFLWSIAPPLMQVLVITFVFKQATPLAAGFPSYSAFVLVAMIPWTYFQTTILDSSMSILMLIGVIRKVYIPREVIPLAAAISNFIHFLLSWAVFFVYWWVIRRAPVLPTTLLFPYLIMVQFMLVTGLSLLVSCLNVFYEDVKYIVSILMNLALFLLPIVYLIEQVESSKASESWYHPFLVLHYRYNPLCALINGYRKSLLEAPDAKAIPASYPIDYGALAWTGAVSFMLLIACYWYFNQRKWQFVERP